MTAGALLPITGASYLFAWIIAMAIFGTITGRDIGFGDGFDLPLNNGYRYSAIDITEVATIYSDRRDGGYSAAVVDNVLKLQQQGDWLAGGYMVDLNRTDFNETKWKPNHWFLINTRTREYTAVLSETALKQLAVQHGFVLNLESSSGFYGHQRYRWYDAVVAFLLLVPALIALVLLYRKARRLLRVAREATGSAAVTTPN